MDKINHNVFVDFKTGFAYVVPEGIQGTIFLIQIHES